MVGTFVNVNRNKIWLGSFPSVTIVPLKSSYTSRECLERFRYFQCNFSVTAVGWEEGFGTRFNSDKKLVSYRLSLGLIYE